MLLASDPDVDYVEALPSYEQGGYVWSDHLLRVLPLQHDLYELAFLAENASAASNQVIKFSTEVVETGAPSSFTLVSKPTAEISYDFGPGITWHDDGSAVSISLPAGQSTMTMRLTDYAPGSYVYNCSAPPPACFPGTLVDQGALVLRVSVGTPAPVPEPSTLALMGIGLTLIGLGRQRRWWL